MSVSEKIKSSVRLIEVVLDSGVDVNKNNFCRCPYHDERTASFKVYKNDRFKCFSCGKSGSVIDYVMAFYGLEFWDACKKIDFDYKLNLFSQNPTRDQILIANQEKIRREKKRKEDAEIAELCTYQINRINALRRWFWERTHNESILPVEFLDRLLDKKIFPVNYDVDQMLKCLYLRWKDEVINDCN